MEKKKIKIFTDTASDIDIETAQKYGIQLLPITITIGEKSYKDRYELTADQFYEIMKSGVIPKTSQITISEHYDEFKKFSDEYTIIYVPLSSKGSGTYQSANMAKQMIEEENCDADINIIECLTYAYGYGFWVIEAAKMANDGKSKQEIMQMLDQKLKKSEIILAVDDLQYLQKGGRISTSAKVIASVLDIKPILIIEDGLVMSREKVRGTKKLIPKMISMVQDAAEPDFDQTIVIMHGDVPQKAVEFESYLKENTNFKNTQIVEVGPCVGVHAGPGVIGILYQKKQ